MLKLPPMAVVKKQRLLPGDLGTDQTIREMERLVDKGRADLVVNDAAIRIIRAAGVAPKDYAREVTALFRYVRDKVRYVKDPISVELVHSAAETLKRRAGDCDDKAVLLATLLQSVGHKTRFQVVATRPGDFHHVLIQAQVGGRWVPLDPTVERAAPGWESSRIIRRRVYGESATVADLGGYDFRQVENVARTVNREYVEAAARAEIARDLAAGQLSLVDIRLSRAYLAREARFSLPEWQRAMADKLAAEAERVLENKPALDISRSGVAGVDDVDNLGGFFKSLWNGVKKVVSAPVKLVAKGVKAVGKTVLTVVKGAAKVAKVVGPFLVIIPGIGPIAAAAVTAGGQLLAPGQPIPADATPISELPEGYEFQVSATGLPATVPGAATVVADQYAPVVATMEPQASLFSSKVAGVPMPIILGIGALALILIAKK
jgi:hypothetical protein